jgi:hypothetical protein
MNGRAVWVSLSLPGDDAGLSYAIDVFMHERSAAFAT